MNLNFIQKSVFPLFFATIFLGVFYWQFTHIYPFVIEYFRKEKLSLLYGHLFIYSFLVQVLYVSLINLINNYLIKSKIFLITSIGILIIFYLISFSHLNNILQYFINYPLSDNAIIGIIFFVVLTFGYSLYSIISPFIKNFIPLSHLFIFTLLATLYSGMFINTYCYPISEIITKFQ